MQAVIMAGGEGSRLRPLTGDMPKPLAKLCGRPVLEYILDLLGRHGCDRAALTLMYKGNKIVRHFDGNDYKGIELSYVFEDKPLGTAGSVKNAARDFTDDFLVISGDAMCDFDLTAVMAYHKQMGAMATLVVKSVEDPREYGLVNVGPDGKVAGFLEKPPLSHCVTDLANTGVYVLSPKVLELIEDGRSVDFAQDVFPEMLRRGLPIFACPDGGYWCDIGSLQSFVQCNRDMLEGKVACAIPGRNEGGVYYKGARRYRGCTILPPAYIGENVELGQDTIVEAGTVIGDGVVVGDHAVLHGTVVDEAACLGDRVHCEDAVICENARILRGASVGEGSAVGANAVIGENAVIGNGSRVFNDKTVPNDLVVTEDLQFGSAREVVCEEDGICGETNVAVTPALCLKIGGGVASLSDRPSIGVSSDGSPAGEALAEAVCAGALSSGGSVWRFGPSVEPQFAYCLSMSMADYGIYVHAGPSAQVKVFAKDALPLSRGKERKLEGLINRSEAKRVHWDGFARQTDLSGLQEMYGVELLKYAPQGLEGIRVQVKTANPSIRHMMEGALRKLGAEVMSGHPIGAAMRTHAHSAQGQGGCISLHITADGRSIAAYDEETGYLFGERVLALLCLSEFQKGRDVALPNNAPQTIEHLAGEYGRKILRYYDCPCDESDCDARRLAAKQSFVRDGLMMGIMLLSLLHDNQLTLREAAALVPDFSVASRLVAVGGNPALILKQLAGKAMKLGEGVHLSHGAGSALLRPIKSGRGIMLFTEGEDSETAEELCDFFEQTVKGMHLDSEPK